MKIQIRNNVFETNSSSTHSIAIPNEMNTPLSYISFSIGEFGWSWEEADPADYFYTAIYEVSPTIEEANDKISRLKEILESNDIKYTLGEVRYREFESNGHKYLGLDNGYIDHSEDLIAFIEELLNDEYKLLRFLGGGLVFTGNDNSYPEQQTFINRDQEYLEDYDFRSKETHKIENPYYMSNHTDYEWYWKGN